MIRKEEKTRVIGENNGIIKVSRCRKIHTKEAFNRG